MSTRAGSESGAQRARDGQRTVGMVGAGQLARMGWQAAISLDIGLVCLGGADDSAARAGAPVVEGGGRDPQALARLAESCEVLTFEHELVDLDVLADLERRGVQVRPSPAVLALAVDKLHQRQTLAAMEGVAVPAYRPVSDGSEVEDFAAEYGWPVVMKARSGGYDGRGVWMCDGPEQVQAAFRDGREGGLELYVEEAVDLAGEAAIMVARSPSGEVAVYPVVDTYQQDGMCRTVVLPAGVPDGVAAGAQQLARTLAEQIGLEGLMAIELFLCRDGEVLVNELALRAHNTGHLHTEAITTSQFEQHLRAVLDLPLGAVTPLTEAAAMVNIVGPVDGSDPRERLGQALQVPAARVHLYGKQARPGRKLGHVTVCGGDRERVLAQAQTAADSLEAVDA